MRIHNTFFTFSVAPSFCLGSHCNAELWVLHMPHFESSQDSPAKHLTSKFSAQSTFLSLGKKHKKPCHWDALRFWDADCLICVRSSSKCAWLTQISPFLGSTQINRQDDSFQKALWASFADATEILSRTVGNRSRLSPCASWWWFSCRVWRIIHKKIFDAKSTAFLETWNVHIFWKLLAFF